MNSKSKRLVAASIVLLIGLVAFAVILTRSGKRSANGGDDTVSGKSGDKESLTALTPGSSSSPEVAPTVRVLPSPTQLLSGKRMLPVSAEEVEQVLARGDAYFSHFIAAQAILGDFKYLKEAAEKYPDNPRVQFWMLANRVQPGERKAWLEKFKESDPDNALANYLAAEQAFRKKDSETGIAELRAALGKGYADYSDDLQDEVGEMYRAVGKYDDETVWNGSAKVISMPHVEQVQALSQRLVSEHERLAAEGDTEAAEEIFGMGKAMLETVAGNSHADGLGSRTMLLFMQEKLHRAAGDPDGALEALSAERQRLGKLGIRVREILVEPEGLTDVQLRGYAQQLHEEGEVAAAEWLVKEIGEPE